MDTELLNKIRKLSGVMADVKIITPNAGQPRCQAPDVVVHWDYLSQSGKSFVVTVAKRRRGS